MKQVTDKNSTVATFLGKRGAVTLPSQSDAERYLINLPDNYAGRTTKLDSGKWMVSYHHVG